VHVVEKVKENFLERRQDISSGVILGDHVGHLFERRIEPLGGVILIGLRILVEHLM